MVVGAKDLKSGSSSTSRCFTAPSRTGAPACSAPPLPGAKATRQAAMAMTMRRVKPACIHEAVGLGGNGTPPLLEPVCEAVGLAFRPDGGQRHLTLRPGIGSSAAGNREYGIATVVERPLNRDLALIRIQRPEALPCLAGNGAEADALVGTHLVLVVGVEHLVGKGENVTGAVALRASVGYGISRGVLDDLYLLRGGRTGSGEADDGGDRGDAY